jgi:hypothetical protein
MIEAPTDKRTRDAYRAAHDARGAALRHILRRVTGARHRD